MIDDALLTLALSPILVPQGIYTKKVTPKLPEPEGSREGILGNGEPLRILILGDSAAAGVGVDSQNDALLGQLVSKLSQYRAIEWRLLAETGLKTSEMLERLHALEAFKTDVVITSLGVNDITGGTRLKHWLEQQRELKLLLQDKFQARHIFLSSVPPMHE
ncbi:SGNH/GDSL hydrolase family protein, partial [Oleiphilus sp. HI0086]